MGRRRISLPALGSALSFEAFQSLASLRQLRFKLLQNLNANLLVSDRLPQCAMGASCNLDPAAQWPVDRKEHQQAQSHQPHGRGLSDPIYDLTPALPHPL